MGFSKQEYWSGLPCPPLEDLPDPGIKPQSPALQAESLLLRHQGSPCTCVCIHICMYVYICWNASAVSGESCSVVSDSLWPHGLYSPRNSPGQNTGVGRLSLLQRTFLNQELNQGLLHCRQILYQLSYEGSICSKYTFMPICVNICVYTCVLSGCEEWENEASLGSWTKKPQGPLFVLQFKVFEDFQSNFALFYSSKYNYLGGFA